MRGRYTALGEVAQTGMKAIVDVRYERDRSIGGCVMFEQWEADVSTGIITRTMPAAAAYRPGRFYQRELPCLLALLEKARRERPVACRIDTVLIDGYVHLDPEVGTGLGDHLYEALGRQAAVIGIAKSPLPCAVDSRRIYRGGSTRPLYISAAGCSLDRAAAAVERMHGPHRKPALVQLADAYTRAVAQP